MDKLIRASVVLAFSLTGVPAFAGIADSPLPVLQVGVNTLHLYSVPGVLNDGGNTLATYFICTSASTSSMVVGVEVFGPGGGNPLNNAATTAVTLAAGGTVTFGTALSPALSVDSPLGPGPVQKGSARIVATSKSLICTAFIADFGSAPPASMVELTIVAKTKQKAAN
jgi:hypothetical protein